MSQPLPEQPFISHLLELRDRLMRMVIAILVLLVVLFPFGNDIFTILSQPVVDALPEGSSMLATKVLSPFLTPLKLAFVAALMLAMPYLLYQLWGFVAPGLYQHERRLAFPMLASSVVLFYSGAAFAYFVVLPLLFPFLVGVVPQNVEVAPDIADFLDVAIKLFFAFGMAFEVPIATILLVVTGMTTPEKLAQKRPYVIVGAFVIGMLMTPPDIISQTLLAIPVWLLFELGVVLSRLFLRRRKERQAAEAAAAAASSTAGAEAATDDSMAADRSAAASQAEVVEPDDYRPMTEEEMERELDALDEDDEDYEEQFDGNSELPKDLDASEDLGTDQASSAEPEPASETPKPEPEGEPPEPFVADAVDAKLEQVMALRDAEQYEQARTLLYEVLVEGNETQVKVARNILAQLDS